MTDALQNPTTPKPKTSRRRNMPSANSNLASAATILFLVLAAVPLLALAIKDEFLIVIATRIMIFAIAALSLNLILGYGAMVSFGHAAYIGIGAYAVAILSLFGITDIGLQMIVAVLTAGLFAAATGAISLRTKGVYFIMITLAFGQMAYFFMVSLSALGGDDGITLSGRSSLLGKPLLDSNFALFYLTLGFLAVTFFLLRMLIASRFGRVLRGTRDNAVRMNAIGFAPFPYQLVSYVIAGAIAAVAGVLLANQVEFVSPAYMTWQRSGELIVMVVLGGLGTLLGPVIGAVAFILMEEWLSAFSEHWKLALGLILLLVVLFGRGGIGGLFKRITGGASNE